MEPKLLLTIQECCDRLSCGKSHLYKYIGAGQLRTVKLGKSRRVPVEALRDFIACLMEEEN